MSGAGRRLASLPPEARARLEERLRKALQRDREPGPRPRPRDAGPAPLSPSQEWLWFDDHWDPERPVYTESVVLELDGPPERAALGAGLTAVARRHEALRTHFVHRDGEVRAAVAPPGPVPVPVVDLSALPAPRRRRELRALAEAEAGWRFRLEVPPLLRCTLLRSAPDRHVMILAVHHIVFDGWSMGILFRELAAVARCRAHGDPVALDDPPLQYRDFAAWHRERLAGGLAERQLAFWRRRLAGAPTVLELPADHPRPAVRTGRGETSGLSLSPELSERLLTAARDGGVTLFVMLTAAFAALIHRLSGRRDFLVATPSTLRSRRELEAVIGLFVNTVPLRVELAPDQPFVDLVAALQAVTADVYAHNEVPFARLVDAVVPERDLSRPPLCQVMFDFQRTPVEPFRPVGVGARLMEMAGRASKFDLTLAVKEAGDGLRLRIEHSADLFDPTTGRRILEGFAAVLREIARAPERRLAELDLLGPARRHQVLVEWNDAGAVGEIAEPIHCTILERASRHPDRVALWEPDRYLSYGGLASRSAGLAGRLRAAGVGPEVCVGVFLERSIDVPVAFLGVLRAGGAYVPLDADYPPLRLRGMMEDCGARVLVTERRLRARAEALSPPNVRILCLDEPRRRASGPESPLPMIPPEPPGPTEPSERAGALDHLAYVVFTSGSTGRPKGVLVDHRNLASYLRAMRAVPAAGFDGTLLSVASPSFDITVLDYYLPLLAGGRVAVAGSAAVADGSALRGLLERGRATVLQATPVTWRLLLEAGWPGRRELTAFSGGEALPPELARSLAVRTGSLWNLYGPSETTVWCTAGRVGAGEPVTLGRPLANARVHVLDGALRPAPLGVPGQLHVGGSGGGSEGGSGLARGYRGRPAATAACFVPDPTGLGGPGGRLYATGDLVRSGPDGRLRFLGRIDHQVKLRGHRIELGEIEQVLLEHPAVAEAAVVLREDRPGDQRLVAYVSGGEADPERLREHLLARLPAFMVPAAFVRLERLPRTPNRKLDRAALPAPALPEPAEEPSRRPPPESAAGRTLAEIWAEILGVEVDRLGAGDDFFGLGGHSLLVSRLLVRVRERLGVELALAEIFRNSTLEGLARQVEARQAEARQVELGGAAPAGRPATLPRCLMAIRTGGAAPPLFLVHPASGSPLCFVDLALRLGEERPVFGFQSPLLEGDRWRPRSLGEMAVRYVDEMRAVRPAGPYLLGGWSFGCAVAYEMARLLERDGQEVGLLFLLDAGPEVPAGRAGASGPRRTLGLFTETARLVAGTPLPRSYRDLRVLASWAGVSLPESPRAIWRRPWKARLRFLAELARQVVRSIDAFRSNLAPALRYRPRPYAGRAVLFRAREGRPPSGRDALADDVRRLAHGGAEIVEVPGNHMTLLDRHHAGGLAARVDELLAPGPDGALGPNRPQSNHDDPLQGDRR